MGEAATTYNKSRKARVKWTRYGECDTCHVPAQAPCRDLHHKTQGWTNYRAHRGRLGLNGEVVKAGRPKPT